MFMTLGMGMNNKFLYCATLALGITVNAAQDASQVYVRYELNEIAAAEREIGNGKVCCLAGAALLALYGLVEASYLEPRNLCAECLVFCSGVGSPLCLVKGIDDVVFGCLRKRRAEYDLRTFEREQLALIQQQPRAEIMHAPPAYNTRSRIRKVKRA